MQGAGANRLDGNDLDAPAPEGRNSGDEPAAACRDEDRVETGRIGFPFERDSACPGNGLHRIIGMDRDGAGLRYVARTGDGRIGIARPADDDLRTVAADGIDLGLRRDLGHEDMRRDAEHARGIGHRRSVIPPPDAAATPASGTCVESRLLKAPRVLKDPACWRNSSFKEIGPSWPKAPPGRSSSGV